MIDKSFAHHTPSPEALSKINNLRLAYSTLKKLLEESCPKSREASLALTHLEESAMWGTKAVVVNDPNSKVEDKV